jgi:iron complex transport system substrate-binding protein
MRCAGFVLSLLAFTAPALAAAPQQRVASVFLCTDEYLFRLLPRQRIAALSFLAADRHPVVSTIADQVQGIPLVANSAEAVLASRPDAVVLMEGSSAGVRNVLKAAKIPVIDVAWPNTLAEIPAITRRLAAALGVPARGEALVAEMDRRLAAVRAAAPRPAVTALLYEANGYTVSGGITGALMAEAGLVNMAPQMRPTRQSTVPIETVVAKAPELLIFNGRAGIVDSRARQVLEHPALRRLPKTHATWLSLNGLLCPGPWSVEAAERFSAAAREARVVRAHP